MKIAVCDDEPILLNQVANLLQQYRLPNGSSIIFHTFSNALDLIDSMEKEKYDVLILDIIMPGFSGMDAAHDIRRVNQNVNIIFLTSSPEFAVESYKVHAFNYLMKPVDKDDLFSTLNRITLSLDNETSDVLRIETPKKIFSIPYKSIEYVSVNNRTIEFHMIDNTITEINGHLNDYEERILSQKTFLKIHRSYIINMINMSSLTGKDFITKSGDTVPIARGLQKDIKEQYLSFVMKQ